jgi:transposase-like protein
MRTRRPRPATVPRSAFAGFCFAPEVIVLAVRWYLRFALSYRDVEELLVAGRLRYAYRAIDQFGQVIDVFVSLRRDARAAHQFFERAVSTIRIRPVEVITDRAPTYPVVLDGLLPAAWHRTDRYANNAVEAITAG